MSHRILIAGIGNIFLGDDAFGCEVVKKLAERPWPDGARIKDFGIRGFDLAYALMDGYNQVILVDAVNRGKPPGTLTLLEPRVDGPMEGEDPRAILMQPHSMTPEAVLRFVQLMGCEPPPLYLLGCEPSVLGTEDHPVDGLSEVVEAAVGPAVNWIARLVDELRW